MVGASELIITINITTAIIIINITTVITIIECRLQKEKGQIFRHREFFLISLTR